MTDKPIPEAYWVLEDRFLAGGYPASLRGDETAARRSLDAFLEAGIRAFFDLTRPGELPPYEALLQEEAGYYGLRVAHRRFAVQDKGLPMEGQMAGLLDALDETLAAGERVYLHCWGGIGRTGTAVGCWLVRRGLSGEAALARLAELYRTSEQSRFFPRSPENDAQRAFVRAWSEKDERRG